MKRLLITGANGGLGTLCRNRLAHMADILRLSSNTDLGEAAAHEEIMLCDLSDKDAVAEVVKDCDGIVHMGGQSIEAAWDVIRAANIDGVLNLYEGARKHGVKRILFASSVHAVGFHEQTTLLDANSPTRPDGLYGVSKVFGEAMARMYYDKFGIETACLRIGSCFPEPADHRMLNSWLSPDDFIRLIERVFTIQRLGCPIIYGCSDNQAVWWDNREVAYLGWKPQDSSEVFRAKKDAEMAQPDRDDPRAKYQGGLFCSDGIHES
jgi:uronate dehydrogenase